MYKFNVSETNKSTHMYFTETGNINSNGGGGSSSSEANGRFMRPGPHGLPFRASVYSCLTCCVYQQFVSAYFVVPSLTILDSVQMVRVITYDSLHTITNQMKHLEMIKRIRGSRTGRRINSSSSSRRREGGGRGCGERD